MKFIIAFLCSIGLLSCGQKTSDETLKKMVDDGAFVVDVRTPSEFAHGSVKGAVNIPLSSVEGRIEEFKNKNGVVVFCRSGNRSGKAKKMLEKAGIKNVVNGINTSHMNQALSPK